MSSNAEPRRTTPTEPDTRTRTVPAARRAAAMLWQLGQHPEGMTLSALARDLDVLPSTCLHIVRELVAARFVAYQSSTKRYRLGSGVLTLARQMTHQSRFVQVAQPLLYRLSREFQVAASAQERDGEDGMVVVAAVSALPGDMAQPGTRLPMFTSASGRLLAAFNAFAEDELRARFAHAHWQDAPAVETWLKEVRATRRNGYAIDEGRYRKGVTTVAGPVFGNEETLDRAISIMAVSAQIDARMRKNLVGAVKAAANEISQALR
jgi:DNA-binding IclR family transcriptional regulator